MAGEGRPLEAVVSAPSSPFTDFEVSPGMTYSYSITARNSAGASPPSSLQVRNDTESADHAYVALTAGTDRVWTGGDQPHQTLVCNTFNTTSQTWTSASSQVYDWGYPTDRAWVPTKDGKVAYCRRVINGNQLTCEIFNGQTWTGPKTLAPLDAGYQ